MKILKSLMLGMYLFFAVILHVSSQTITIDLGTEYQSLTGFGGINMPGWINDLTTDQADKAFGNDPGQMGLTILRVRVPYDTTQFFREVPTAIRAKNHGAIVFASPWSPPAGMKSNNSTVGGYLLPEYYGSFADHLLAFASYMKNHDASLHAISLQNEPDVHVDYESCDWTSQQMIDFLKEQGSKLETTNIIVAESYHFNKNMTDPILNDTAVEKYVGIIGGHIYGGGLSDYPLAREKGKEVWMTEHFTESAHSADQWPLALDVATEINNCMKANYNGYVWWYLRRFYGPIDDGGNITKRGYIMSQFSKFIRPGTTRVGAIVTAAPNVDATAYKTDSSYVIIVVNRNATSVDLEFTIQNGAIDTLTKYSTSATKSLLNDGGISVSGNAFTATVDASSITTFSSCSGNAGRFGNTQPIADAGPDSELYDTSNTGSVHIILDGTGSVDPDGEITNYSWSLDGIQIAWEPTFEGVLNIGEHELVLTVTDNDGARSSDTSRISVISLNNTEIWLEAECGQVGSTWNIPADNNASNGEYVTTPAGTESLNAASTDTSDYIVFPVHLTEAGVYKLWGRVITPTANDDSYWVKVDDGAWAMWNSIPGGSTWHWAEVFDQSNNSEIMAYQLDTGYHALSICFREDGALLDKLLLTNMGTVPVNIGGTATNCPDDTALRIGEIPVRTVKAIKVFPNPAQSEINISWDEAFTYLEIISITGENVIQKCYNLPIKKTIVQMDLNPGLYILRLSNNSHYGLHKLIIE
jgi:O-glycosyl hydrolase